MGRTIADLSGRLNEEARSSTAVFIPSVDVLGNANSGTTAAHEVDFFRRLSAGGDAFVAYRFDASSGDVTRYEYAYAAGTKIFSNEDIAASGVAAFSVSRVSASALGAVAGVTHPLDVAIMYGRRELSGGNDVVIVSVQPRSHDGISGSATTIHLASRIAPTALAVLAPKGAATPPPTIRVFPFVILRPGFPVTLPHGPMHGGSLGGSPDLIHWVAAVGSAQFYGPSSDVGTWFELSSFYTKVESGIFIFKDSSGSSITASISCTEGPCPSFKPLPVSAPVLTPAGSVAFQMIP